MPHYAIPRNADLPALAAEIVANAKAENAKVETGVSWSAMGPYVPEVPKVEAVLAQLKRQVRDAAEQAASPEGRFHAAAFLIYRATGDERLLQAYSRGLDTNHDLAAELLADMAGPAADQAGAALCDWHIGRAAAQAVAA